MCSCQRSEYSRDYNIIEVFGENGMEIIEDVLKWLQQVIYGVVVELSVEVSFVTCCRSSVSAGNRREASGANHI